MTLECSLFGCACTLPCWSIEDVHAAITGAPGWRTLQGSTIEPSNARAIHRSRQHEIMKPIRKRDQEPLVLPV
jgi:hypothetical protein